MIAGFYLVLVIAGCSNASLAPTEQVNSTPDSDSLIYITDSSFWGRTSPCELLGILKANSSSTYVFVSFPDDSWFHSPDTTCFGKYLTEDVPSAAFVSAYSSVDYNDLNRTIATQTATLREALRRGRFLHSPPTR